MLSLVYVQWPEAEMLEAHWLQAGHVLFSTFEASEPCSGKKRLRPGVKQTMTPDERQERGRHAGTGPQQAAPRAQGPHPTLLTSVCRLLGLRFSLPEALRFLDSRQKSLLVPARPGFCGQLANQGGR